MRLTSCNTWVVAAVQHSVLVLDVDHLTIAVEDKGQILDPGDPDWNACTQQMLALDQEKLGLTS